MSNPETEISMQQGDPGNANLVYILYLVSIVLGITGLVGVIMAYIGRNDADEMVRSHYTNQINIFWKCFLFSVIGILLTVVFIGLFILLGALIWYIVRCIKGMQSLGRGEAIANPQSWGF